MNEMIKIEDGFQYSVNIAYDLQNKKKLQSFIPTKDSLKFIEEVLLSTKSDSTERARVLVGAYGKGKSHLVLTILNLLKGETLENFPKLKKEIEKDNKLKTLIQNYSKSKNKLLPVLITGTSSSVSQNFLNALEKTLLQNKLDNLMPETNFKSAIQTILRWQKKYPKTLLQFEEQIGKKAETIIEKLQDYNNKTYEQFLKIYPELTSGGKFNPFGSFDVVEIFESVIKSLKEKTEYTGIYVVYDEFSKYLETNIAEATISDTKMLQDFAEKCNRSGKEQLHLMLICHKEISNYIDKLPKQKIDGWRGISERFLHVRLNNNFSQTYEVIQNVIIKDEKLWNEFAKKNEEKFQGLISKETVSLFNEFSKEQIKQLLEGCYPLHPVSIYILPRLSEKIAQNERTLFTFLSSKSANGLEKFLQKHNQDKFNLLTPDVLYDYFEPLFQKEIYSDELYKTYILTSKILEKICDNCLESKIIKTISLIYILQIFEKLTPSKNTIIESFRFDYSREEVEKALDSLVKNECLVYLKRSNNFYSLKQSSGVDITAEIQKRIQKNSHNFSLKQTLNQCNFNKFLYPLRYNDENEITRYFSFSFIAQDEIKEDTNWTIKSENIKADGVIYAVLLKTKNSRKEVLDSLTKNSYSSKCVFILPKKFAEIEKIAQELNAVAELKSECQQDSVLQNEYEIIYDDLMEVIDNFVSIYTQSQNANADYFYNGEIKIIKRKSDVSELLSDICDKFYSKTPKIVNEALNKNIITSMSLRSRNKIVAELLKTNLQKQLGITSSQELSVMQSVLYKTQILCDDDISDCAKINLIPADKKVSSCLDLIKNYFTSIKQGKQKSFELLYKDLTSDKNGIGMRKGIIPLFVACVVHEYKKQIIFYHHAEQVLLSVELLNKINEIPEEYSAGFMDWSQNEEDFIKDLSLVFEQYIIDNEKNISYDFVFNAMRRWYVSLPKFTKDTKLAYSNSEIPQVYKAFLKDLKQATSSHEFIFVSLRKLFASVNEIKNAKEYFDKVLDNAILFFKNVVYKVFASQDEKEKTLCKVLFDWSDSLNKTVFNVVFSDNTSKFLQACNVQNDSDLYLIKQIGLIATDLKFEDWNDKTFETAIKNIKGFKANAENSSFEGSVLDNQNNQAVALKPDSYQLNFADKDGKLKSKIFDKAELSQTAFLLDRSIRNSIKGMALSINESEKRQVLVNILLELCGGK